MADEPFLLKFPEHGQQRLNRSLERFEDRSNPKVDDIETIDPKISQVVMNTIDQLLAGKSRNPGPVCTPTSAYFGDDHETIRVGMERLLDNLIRHMRTVEVGVSI